MTAIPGAWGCCRSLPAPRPRLASSSDHAGLENSERSGNLMVIQVDSGRRGAGPEAGVPSPQAGGGAEAEGVGEEEGRASLPCFLPSILTTGPQLAPSSS